VFAENRGQIDVNWSADGPKMVFGYVVGTANLSIRLLDLKAQKVTGIPGSEGLISPCWFARWSLHRWSSFGSR